jgi:hypothetical protein
VPSKSATVLDADQQDRVMQWLTRGGSPMVACQRLDVSITSFLKTLQADAEFAERIRQVQTALSQNVAACLYRAALEGNVAAQRHYLQLNPPPDWKPAAPEAGLEELEPHELADEYRAAGLDVPAELQALAGRADRRVEP